MTDQSVCPPGGEMAQSGAAPSPALSATNAAGADSSPPSSRFPVSKLRERRLAAVVFAALTEYVPALAGREQAIAAAVELAGIASWSHAQAPADWIIRQLVINVLFAAGLSTKGHERYGVLVLNDLAEGADGDYCERTLCALVDGATAPKPAKGSLAAQWLRDYLTDGPRRSSDITAASEFARTTLQNAAKSLGVVTKGRGPAATWELPA